MKRSDRTILLAVALIALAAAFYFLILAPKRQQAADLETQVSELRASVVQAEQAALAGEQAKSDFSSNYRHLITLGKAVPVDADTPSLLTQMEALSKSAAVDFRSITLAGGAGAAPAPSTPAAIPTAAVPTEATAALLPIGATIGTAGLPVMGYAMEFEGGFFGIADFFGEIDDMVATKHDGETVSVDGRLITIDGFNLAPGPNGLPSLSAEVQVSSYLSPADQGITGGASPTGPPTEVPATTTPVPADPAVPAVSAAVSN